MGRTSKKNPLPVFRTGGDYRFVDAEGRRVSASQLTVEYCIKAEHGEPRQSYRVQFAGRPALMKVRQLPDLRGQVRAAFGHAYLRREQRFIEVATGKSLPVVRCLGHGWKRERGLVTEQVLLLEWLDGRRVLRDVVHDAYKQGNIPWIRRRLLPAMNGLLAAVREAGISDKDFGA